MHSCFNTATTSYVTFACDLTASTKNQSKTKLQHWHKKKRKKKQKTLNVSCAKEVNTSTNYRLRCTVSSS